METPQVWIPVLLSVLGGFGWLVRTLVQHHYDMMTHMLNQCAEERRQDSQTWLATIQTMSDGLRANTAVCHEMLAEMRQVAEVWKHAAVEMRKAWELKEG